MSLVLVAPGMAKNSFAPYFGQVLRDESDRCAHPTKSSAKVVIRMNARIIA